ncbi:hypothetical protein FRACYDRAFT_250994 [Fragilariopsis cylindrus CCMP1102]|uniref:PHD-type domain-containing protein n=1 Tax=Fragilariopsis cylindrus CCMP1102 TaxID=635003 RepID=A0A1E7ENN0_9STRA|nr:hypothetical protein FRACYDRAFT_250994 [Fragilariopsis cylindrus CCMP1102]|eukprot:OEU07572.1 hypothetical protein FRACYDRAFT_250994 [Fragilariopsis cylindrus CCMP1102]
MCYSKKDQNKQQKKQQGNLPTKKISPKSPQLLPKASAASASASALTTRTKIMLPKLPEESPTTKTLNSLSQNMDDLYGYDYNYNNYRSSNNNCYRTIMKQRRQSQKKSHCIVTKVKKNGWGYQHGLQENDWFLQPMTTLSTTTTTFDDDHDDLYDESQKSCHPYYNKIAIEKYFNHGPLKLASFHEIQEWTRSNDSGGGGGGGTNNNSNYRPVRILRKRRNNNNSNNRNRTTTSRTSATTNKARKTPTTLTTTTATMKTPTITTNKRKMTTAKDVTPNTSTRTTTTVTIPKVPVPCMHCGKLFKPNGVGAHQYHCKMNPAKKNKATTTAAAAAATTSTSTRGNQKRPSQTAAAAVAKKNSSSTSNNKRKRTTSNSVTLSSSRRRNNESDNDNGEDGESECEFESEVDDDDNDESVYNNVRNRKKGKNTRRGHQAAAAGATVPSRKTAPPTKLSRSNKKKNPTSNKQQQREDTAISSRQEEATASTAATAKNNNSNKNDSSIIVSKPKWIPLYDNPWGEEGYQDGDVLLFGPQRGIGHYEIHFPSLRYKTNPFEKNSMYNNTHCTPQEGLSVVCLNRDPLGNIPWGFNVTRHEFDHACLVKTIDMNSPASAAKFVGIPSSDQQQQQTCCSGLNVYDMIIMINGKKTGGMTEAGFELELDLNYLDAQEIGNGATRMDPSCQLSSSSLMIEDSTTTATTNNASKYNRRSEQQQLRTMPIGESATTLDQTILSESNKSKDGSNGNKLVKNGRNGVHSKKKDAAFEHRRENLKFAIGSDVDERGEAHRSSFSSDQNPCMGCICGELHDDRFKKFWLQCESCKSWYDVAQKCIGFGRNKAENIVWHCEACVPPN